MATLSMLMIALTAGAAYAATIYGTNYGDALYGTSRADTMHGYGGADLMYGYGGADLMYGGNEAGWGDKLLGGTANDRIYGQNGDDALYGESGNDRLYAGYGDDLVQGGYGNDTLNAGPGADRINAQDGQRDYIELCGSGAYDLVYYDRGLDVLLGCASARSTSESASLTTAEAGKIAKLSVDLPPKGLFEHSGKVLVEKKGKELCVPEKSIKGHIEDGAKIINPTECSNAKQGRS